MEASNNPPGLRGYVTSRPFGGLYVPVPMQSTFLRNYCARNGYLYKLHVNENSFAHSYLVLESVLEEIEDYAGIVCCSAFMLPANTLSREKIYRRLLDADASIHFVLDGNAICSADDVDAIETNLRLSSELARAPTPDAVRTALNIPSATP